MTTTQKRIRRRMVGTALLSILGSLAMQTSATSIAPTTAPNADGDSNNMFPFDLAHDRSEVPGQTQRYQQVFDAAMLAGMFPGGAIIHEIHFRTDGGLGHNFSSTLPHVRINLSTTSAGENALSTTFSSNIGLDNTTVYDGPLTLTGTHSGTGPQSFDVSINFTNGFNYNPAKGNLLMDVQNIGGGATTYFDSANRSGDGTSRIFTLGSGAGSSTADGGDTQGLIVDFGNPRTAAALVPEPAGVSVMLMSVGMFSLRRRKRSA